jgi:predicted PurR-regulated permease PerM
MLFTLRPLLALVGLAVVAALTLDPLLAFLQRRHVRRELGVLLLLLVFIGAAGISMLGLVPMFKAQLVQLNDATGGGLRRIIGEWGHLREGVGTSALKGASQFAGGVVGVLRSVAGEVAALVTVLALTVLTLLFGKDLERLALGWLAPQRRTRAELRLRSMRQAVSRYMASALAMATLGAVVTTVLLAVLRVPYFLPVGFVMLGLGLIPTVGPAVGALLVGVSVLAVGGLRRALIAVLIFVVYQALAGNLLSPLVQGKALSMNPLLMTLLLLAGLQLDGVVGAILAIPLAAAAQVWLKEAKENRASHWNEPEQRAV